MNILMISKTGTLNIFKFYHVWVINIWLFIYFLNLLECSIKKNCIWRKQIKNDNTYYRNKTKLFGTKLKEYKNLQKKTNHKQIPKVPQTNLIWTNNVM